jgi:hypothetical protein
MRRPDGGRELQSGGNPRVAWVSQEGVAEDTSRERQAQWDRRDGGGQVDVANHRGEAPLTYRRN